VYWKDHWGLRTLYSTESALKVVEYKEHPTVDLELYGCTVVSHWIDHEFNILSAPENILGWGILPLLVCTTAQELPSIFWDTIRDGLIMNSSFRQHQKILLGGVILPLLMCTTAEELPSIFLDTICGGLIMNSAFRQHQKILIFVGCSCAPLFIADSSNCIVKKKSSTTTTKWVKS